MQELATIRSVGTAVPGYALQQDDIKQFTTALFHENFENMERMISVFGNSCIKTRHLSRPLEWYAESHSFAEANKIFQSVALELSIKAAQEAMERAAIEPGDVGMVLFLSSTGIATPTIDAQLIQRLGLSSHTARVPIWGLGCAGGVAGLARAAQLAGSLPENKVILMVAVELCSLTFQRHDYSKANLVGTSLFGDGAAAVIVAREGQGPVICGCDSTLLPDTEDIMGWELVETGLKVKFSRDIPWIVRTYIPPLIAAACEKWQIKQAAIENYVVHPGGVKVLQAYQESLGITKERLADAYHTLENYGNMSSVSILFVLKRFMSQELVGSDLGLLLALGPGFSVEQVLFRW